jgi:hypothetical protein
MAFSIFCVGLGSLLAAWVLPMLNFVLPHWLQLALLIGGLSLIGVGAALGFTAKRSDSGGISVKMRDHNRIGQIGNRSERE